MTTRSPLISIRIVHIDHHVCEPGPLDSLYCPFSTEPLAQVPVIRVFGATPAGQKACLHVHKAYPYFFVPFDSASDDPEQVQRSIYHFGTLLNHALHVSRKDKGRRQDQYLAAIVLVKGVPFYGYHVGYETFLKIHLLHPTDKARAIDLLQSGVVMNTPFQPYEAHIPFELQFMMDYDLYGMDWLHIRSDGAEHHAFGTRFRQPLTSTIAVPLSSLSTESSQEHVVYTSDNVPMRLQSNRVARSSYCELELDTTVMMIANRLDLHERSIHVNMEHEASFQASLGSATSKKLVKSLATIWADEENRRRERGIETPISPITQNRQREPHHEWSTEARLREKIKDLIQHDGNVRYGPVAKPLTGVLSAFQAVEALYPKEYFDLLAPVQSNNDSQPMNIDDDQDHQETEHQSETPVSSGQFDPSRFSVSEPPTHYPWRTEPSQADIEHSAIDALVAHHSFPSNDTFDEDDLAALAAKAEDEYQRTNDVQEEINENLTEWGNDASLGSTTLRAMPKVQIEYETDQDEDPPELEVSSVIPMSPRQRQSRKFNLPQNDGGSDKLETNSGKRNDPETWDRLRRQSIKRRRKNTVEYMSCSDKMPKESKRIERMQGVGTRHVVIDLTDLPRGPGCSPKLSSQIPSQTHLLSSPTDDPAYFTKFIGGMWSPRAEDQVRHDAFYVDPPQPVSPVQVEEAHNLFSFGENVCEDQSQVEAASHAHTVLLGSTREYVFHPAPPIVDSGGHVTYQEPYFGNPHDVPSRPKAFSNKEFKVLSRTAEYLAPFAPPGGRQSTIDDELWRSSSRISSWMPALPPPSITSVQKWLDKEATRPTKARRASLSQLDRPTAENTFDFKYSPTKPTSKVTRIRDHLDLLSVEVFAGTRGDLLPDPEQDAVQVLFWSLQSDRDLAVSKDGYLTGIIIVGEVDLTKIAIHDVVVDYVEDEESLLYQWVEKVRFYDPDILVGYELHNASWGYLIDRAKHYSIDMIDELSRIQGEARASHQDMWGYRKASIFRVTGRHMINVWRLLRSEVSMTSYTFENAAYHFLHHRMPHFSHAILTSWYQRGTAALRYRLFRYYLDRVRMNLDILEASEVISRTSESARVFGIDFYSVITRGSQYKVESIMFRIAKPENFMLISPNRKQVAEQRAIECLPLVMEPISQFYSSPMLVLDFQSLYPSIMIAYNYCFSTCLGKVSSPGDAPKFGVTELELPKGMLDQVKDHLNVSPNGIMFVKPSIRKSLLAKMLADILETRVMVKRSMGDYGDDHGLLRLLNARQGTLKYIANVTYGYTSASFSGRMPAVEVADSIVQTGRETLEKAIKTIEGTSRWGGKVVYGDTDSVFVHLPGKTREEAFRIGHEIAATITSMNPAPVKLKFEKVYHPCMLIAKKRYVGFKYENVHETEPVFEAKGIETVRRDGTPATQKIMESCLKILFRSQDMSELKMYLYRQWGKILANRVPLQDFIIAKEVRLGSYSVQGLPHGAQIAQAQMANDPRAAPQHGERVPYVVVYRDPSARLKDRVVRPEALLQDSSLRLDAEYYIRKQIIPPLARVFNLVGVDIQAWYDEMPRTRKAAAMSLSRFATHQSRSLRRIDQYYASSHCITCHALTHDPICNECRSKPAQTIHTLVCRQRKTQKALGDILLVCQGCSQLSTLDAASTLDGSTLLQGTGYGDIPCDSLDCPVFYERIKAKGDVLATQTYEAILEQLWPL